MSRVISFRDLQRVPALSKLSETELLKIENDDLVNSALVQLGFDIAQAIYYTPSKHRDLAGDVAVGYRAVGELSGDREYMRSRLCPLIERLIWASQRDPSLAKELNNMMGGGVNLDEDALTDSGEYLDEDIEPDYEIVSAQLRALEDIRDSIRGCAFNEQGNLKTTAEYKIDYNGR